MAMKNCVHYQQGFCKKSFQVTILGYKNNVYRLLQKVDIGGI